MSAVLTVVPVDVLLGPLYTALLGAVLGCGVPVIAYRLAVPAGQPARTACHRCGLPFRSGAAGWTPFPCGPAGRCPVCRLRFGPPMVVVAMAGALSFGLLAAILDTDPALPVFLLVTVLGLLLCVIDLTSLRLPDPLVATAGGLGVVGLVGVALGTGETGRLGTVLAGGLVSGAGYLLLALLPGARLGFGDVKLAAVLGLLLGWLGWRAVLLGLALPHLVNGIVVLGLLATRRVNRRTLLPLGPALLVGALLAVPVDATLT